MAITVRSGNSGLFRQAPTGPEQGIGRTMKYMLMFWVDESAEVTADDDAAMMIAVKAWVEQMTERGVRLHGAPLRSAGDAKIVRVRDGGLLVSDGPFAETKEQIGGYASSSAPTWTRPSR